MLSEGWKIYNQMGSNKDKSNIAIAILEKWAFWYGTKNYFAFWGAPILFSPTVYISCQSCPLDCLFKQCESRKVTDWAENEYTVDENIIATIKMWNNFFYPSKYRNIGLFSLAPCKVITLNHPCILFGISSLLLFWWLSF